MSAAHTPGPWHVNAILDGRIVGDETATNPSPDKLMITNHNATVATVYRARDARLIAAAPDLLAALQFALPYLEIYAAHHARADGRETLAVQAQNFARAALAKAGVAS